MNGSYVLKLVPTLGEVAPGPCPAIVTTPDGRVVCGVVLNPNKYIKKSRYPAQVLSRNFASLIGAGMGCDELLDDDPESEEEKLADQINRLKENPAWVEKTQRALRIIHE
jgi:hypothetical protein